MKTVILAGGNGSRLGDLTREKPKPMVEIGGIPLIVHIMNIYNNWGLRDFIVSAGYKCEVIERYFSEHDYGWKVRVVNTGSHEETLTGGRILGVKDYIDETFCMTYGDGVADVNINALVEFHKKHGGLATATAVHPDERFGLMRIEEEGQTVTAFSEKPINRKKWINGGFFVLEKDVFDYIPDTGTAWEREPLEELVKEGQLHAYKHEGFWKCMDTVKERDELEELWNSRSAPWKVWGGEK